MNMDSKHIDPVLFTCKKSKYILSLRGRGVYLEYGGDQGPLPVLGTLTHVPVQ